MFTIMKAIVWTLLWKDVKNFLNCRKMKVQVVDQDGEVMVIKIKVMETRAFMVIIVVETEVSVVGMMIVAEVVVQEEDKEEVVVDTTTTLPVK